MIPIVFTDLDGTLLNSERLVSTANRACLHRLGNEGTLRVIATGRSLFSFRRAIEASFPADYLIFSSGAGILDLRSGELLFSANLARGDIATISERLERQRVDFMVHYRVPDNHRFVYRRHSRANSDFERRIRLYREYAQDIATTGVFPSPAAQIIAILPPKSAARFPSLESSLSGYQVIRTTSPLDHASVWLEVFPEQVHKGAAAAWLCERLGIDAGRTVGIGNDYNDIHLLDFTAHSYLLGNGPPELQERFRPAASYNDDGFCAAILDADRRL